MTVSDRTYFTLRRLHSLSGVVPVGVFLLEHFFTNSFAVQGPDAFNRAAEHLAEIPYVVLIEVFGIGLPILFHMVLGLVIVTTGQANAAKYRYQNNWMYLLQRVSGLFLVAYILYHVWTTRLSPEVMRGETDLFGMMSDDLRSPGLFAFYVLGVIAASYHFGNGLFGFAIHWGLATGRRAQRNVARLGLAVFLVLSLVGINSLLAFVHRPVRLFERAPETKVVEHPPLPAPAPPGGTR
ncbi:MAG: succinate dehydrogenase [Candidatus Eisenbacteria bacterium]|nr:succinate dehydrogenase [Candidatus Eisenbacteria bacterium]